MTSYYLNVKFSCLLAPSTVDWKTKTKPMLLPYIGNPTDLHILSTFQPKKYLLQVEANKLKVFRICFHFFNIIRSCFVQRKQPGARDNDELRSSARSKKSKSNCFLCLHIHIILSWSENLAESESEDEEQQPSGQPPSSKGGPKGGKGKGSGKGGKGRLPLSALAPPPPPRRTLACQ